MKRALAIAALAHLAVLLFGGLVVGAIKQKQVKRIQEVELVEDVKEDEKPKKEEKETKKVEKVEEPPPDQMPDSTVLEELEQASAPGPALDAVSLSDLESALGGGAGGGDFGTSMGFGSGGVVGGRGGPGGGDGEGGLGGGGFDQKPRLISSVPPSFPSAIRKRGGEVTVLLFINEEGRVVRAAVEKATDPALEGPVVEAVRKWTFEPGIRGGKKAPFKLRQTLRQEAART